LLVGHIGGQDNVFEGLSPALIARLKSVLGYEALRAGQMFIIVECPTKVGAGVRSADELVRFVSQFVEIGNLT
jgi:hypothetical protein